MPQLAAMYGQGLWSTGTRARWDTVTRDKGGRRPLGLPSGPALSACAHRHTPPSPLPRTLSGIREQEQASFIATTAPALTADAKVHAARRHDPETLRESWLPATVSTGSNCELLPPHDPRPQPRVQNLPEGRVRANI